MFIIVQSHSKQYLVHGMNMHNRNFTLWDIIAHNGINKYKQGSGAEDSVGPHSGRPVLLWPTMKIWIVCFHF